ncbi:MAG: recombination protein O N-terminal domain-containing protein, partial [Rhodocyclaceae bacterium]|nr:recombination protein O N-terminal domain-containing protein [Rhodocyclaceae bacterium]
MSATKRRVQAQPGWVLHTWPWRETSLIAEVLTRAHGRLSVVAKGARRPTSTLRGQLMAFQPLLLSWHGAGELKTLTQA